MTSIPELPAAKPNVAWRQIGRPLERTDARGKAVGTTRYAGDYTMPNMLHVKVLRSTMASATLRRLDVSKARAFPGVACVLTAAELPDRLAPTDIPGQTGQQREKTDQQNPGARARALFRRAPGADRGRDPGHRRAGDGPHRGGARAARRRVRSDRGAEAGCPGRPGRGQRGRRAEDPQGRYRQGLRRGRSRDREHLPHAVHRARLPRARGRLGLGQRERRRQHPRLDAGHRAFPLRGRRPRRAAQPRAHHGCPRRRRLRRQGGRDGRDLPSPPRESDRAAGAARVQPRGFAGRPRQAPPLRHDLPHRGEERRPHHRDRGQVHRRCRCLRLLESLRAALCRGGRTRALSGGQSLRGRQGGRHQ